MHELAAQKNGKCLSREYVNSTTHLEWECEFGHRWLATPDTIKNHASWCHVCTNYKPKGKNPKISETKLLKEWDFEKNIEDPAKITTGSDKKLWWKCSECELSYDCQPHVKQRTNCPFCTGRRPSHFYNLATEYPKKAKRFMTDKNMVDPTEVLPGSHNVYWWSCENGHEYELRCDHMTKGGDDTRNCAYCKGIKVWPGESAGDLFPELLNEIDTSKNRKELLFEVSPYSNKKIHWKCKYGHQTHQALYSRTSRGARCSKCSNPYTKPEIRIYSELKTIWDDAELRGKINQIEFDVLLESINVGIEFDGEVWHKNRRIADIQKNSKAADLGITIIRLRNNLDKISQFDQLTGVDITKEDMNILAKNLLNFAEHKYEKKLKNYIKKLSFSGDDLYRKIVAELPSPEYKNSFEARYPSKAKLWDYKKNHPITPDMISHGSTQKMWWLCRKSKHSFDMQPSTFSRPDIKCPVCSGNRIIAETSLAGKYPLVAQEWDFKKNKKIKPNTIAPNSKEKFWWICPDGHSYQATPNNRISMGSGCSVCAGRNPGEGKSFLDLYPSLSQYLQKDERNEIDISTTPTGSHTKLVTDCLECGKTIKKEVRNWIQVYKNLGTKSYICNQCRKLVKFNNNLVSLEDLQDFYGLPKGLIQGRMGHGASAEDAIKSGLGAINPKIIFEGVTYDATAFCEKYHIELDVLKDKIGTEPISEIMNPYT